MIKNVFAALLPIVMLCGCMRGQAVMSMEEFYDYPVGMTAEELETKAGKPFDAKDIGDGAVEYEYIERVLIGNKFAETRHYYFIFKDNKMISKRIENDTRLPRIPDSYEMQTSDNESSQLPEKLIYIE